MSTKKVNNAVIENEVSNLEAGNTMPEQAPLNAVDQAAAELAALKEKMAEAKRKLAEAKKATTKSRPVRLSTFVVLVCSDKSGAIAGLGEEMTKSDVHYCAEKAAIDVLTEDLKCGQENPYYYAVIKRSKAKDEDGYAEERFVEVLYIDPSTNQLVIE